MGNPTPLGELLAPWQAAADVDDRELRRDLILAAATRDARLRHRQARRRAARPHPAIRRPAC